MYGAGLIQVGGVRGGHATLQCACGGGRRVMLMKQAEACWLLMEDGARKEGGRPGRSYGREGRAASTTNGSPESG